MRISKEQSEEKVKFVQAQVRRKASITVAELQARLKEKFGQQMNYNTLKSLVGSGSAATA